MTNRPRVRPVGAVLVLAAIVAAPSAAFGQRTTTGTVIGKVVDSSGAVLPGVTVQLTSPEALGQFSGVTDGQGVYRVTNLPPATYDIRAELSGFGTVIRKAPVRLNAVTEVDFTLSVGTVAETVTVTAESPIVDPERAGLSVNINNQALTTVPVTTNRRFQDAWLVVPGVAVNPATQELTGSERRTSLDGADVTDPYGGDIFAVNLNYDAIQDVEVKALGAEASDGSSMVGQYMNIVTKSGGNQFHGSAALFVIPQSFNGSNVDGIPANRREDYQPDLTLGGPIVRDKIWFFTAYRRVQTDQTFNNAVVPVQRRGNLWFGKITTQLHNNHRLQVSYQYDRTIQANAIFRGTVAPNRNLGLLTSATTTPAGALSSATPQIVSASALGTLIKGGPLASFNYNWVVSSTKVFQFVGSFMVNKPNDLQPNDGQALIPTRVIQTNPNGDILGSLTTVGLEGGFGAIDTSHRSMTYLSPSMTFFVNDKLGSHEFRGGADLYPNIENKTSSTLSPAEFYFRPPGTTGSADVLFERDILRGFDGGTSVANDAYEHHYGAYFQDRWKPSSRVAVKAGVRVETTSVFTADREAVLGSRLPPALPTNTSDREFHQNVWMPNFGLSVDAGHWGVFRGTAQRSYEWLDLGGGDGTSHAPNVLATDIFRASPRTSPTLNQSLPGGFPLGVAFGDMKDGSILNGRTYVNEFSGAWEHKLPHTSSISTTFLWRRNWDYQSGDDLNVTRDPNTGALLGRPFPDYDSIINTYNPNYTWQQNRSLQLLYTKAFAGQWGVNANYSYILSSTIRTRWNSTRDQLQFYGISPDDVLSERTSPRHHARFSGFVKIPYDVTVSMFYTYSQGGRFNVMTGDFPLNQTAPRVVLSNGRSVADPFFNTAYPLARKNDVNMLKADDAHLVNLRIQKSVPLPGGRKVELSGDVFNLFNNAAATNFLSTDVRSSLFAQPTNYVAARVAQLGIRTTF
jgi:Carboxypeptidase regulatory-like domain/TonB dependent receptor